VNCLRNSKATDHNSHKFITQRKDIQADIALFHANIPFLLDDSLSPHSPYSMPQDDLGDVSNGWGSVYRRVKWVGERI
jgi:hypothetical protein